MTNQLFCYWLQGYFEISRTAALNAKQACLIEKQLHSITEELGTFTHWLLQVLEYFKRLEYKTETMDFFLPLIKRSLSTIFLHVIDNSYDTEKSHIELKAIHDGVA
jgi:hypothetical protein